MPDLLFSTFPSISPSRSLPAIYTKEGTCISYDQLAQEVAIYRKKLHVHPGSRVALCAESSLETLFFFLALLELEATPCLLSPRLPFDSIQERLKLCRADFFLENASLRPLPKQPHSQTAQILLFTSASSGPAKLVVLSKEHFLHNVEGAIAPLRLSSLSCYYLSVPLFHVSGLSILFRSLLASASLSLTLQPRVTHLSFVPTQLLRLLENPIYLPHLQCILLGGAPIPPALLMKSLEKDLPIQTTYGMTEMASQITVSKTFQKGSPLHVGKPLPRREVRLLPSKEILVKGDCLCAGYEVDGILTSPFLEGGWFATKDLGAWSRDGHLEILGRKDNLFISGGENIYPEEIERHLYEMPSILLAFVVPIPDPEFGQRPFAFLWTVSSFPLKQELDAHLLRFLPSFYLPVSYRPLPIEALHQGMKISRAFLRQKALEAFN